ncbi:MAG: hypothetical protein ACREEJ_24805, partial [Ensifer adhaerens]
METEARNLGAGVFARLKQREMIRDLELLSLDLQHCQLRTQSSLPTVHLQATDNSNTAMLLAGG